MRKRMMLIGKTSSGKTTLAQSLHRQDLVYRKTQSVQLFGQDIIDLPGEYLEVRALYRALIVTAVETDIVALVQEACDDQSMFAPQFATMFNKPVIGIITKAELANQKQIENCQRQLRLAGAGCIFTTSSYTGEGLEELDSYLLSKTPCLKTESH